MINPAEESVSSLPRPRGYEGFRDSCSRIWCWCGLAGAAAPIRECKRARRRCGREVMAFSSPRAVSYQKSVNFHVPS